ncbi:uncharacterized protein IWZ02DRAFT_465802, partial [Phyllosticta citriasiana]|uniref:uncharacterized protein n=1 Tax=Phyllosticta citriasiana TaxID=595635 RepID=UPI0030FDBAD6
MPSFLPPDLADDLAELKRLTTEPDNARLIDKYEHLRTRIANRNDFSAQDLFSHLSHSIQVSIAKAALEFRHSRVSLSLLRQEWDLDKDRIAEQFPLQAISSKTFIDSLARLTPNKFEDVLEELERAKATRLNPRVKNTRGVSRDPWFIVNDISTVKQLPGMSIRPARAWKRKGSGLDTISETPELVAQPQDQNNADQQDLVQPNVTMRKRAKLTHSSSPSARRSPSPQPHHWDGQAERDHITFGEASEDSDSDRDSDLFHGNNGGDSAEERDVEHARGERSRPRSPTPLSDTDDAMFDGGLAGAEADKSWRGLPQLPGSPPAYPSPISNGQAAFPASPKSRQPRLSSTEDSQSENTSEPDVAKGEPGNNGTSGAGNEVKQEPGKKSTSGTGEQAKEEEPGNRDTSHVEDKPAKDASGTGDQAKEESGNRHTSRAGEELQDEGWLSHGTIWKILEPFVLEGTKLLDISLDAPLNRPLNLAATVRKVIVPFNNVGHWVLFSFSFVNNTAVVYDSMLCLNAQRLKATAIGMGKILASNITWTVEIDQEAHRQTNTWDCGIHIMVTCLYLWAEWLVPRRINSQLWRVLFRSICRSVPNHNPITKHELDTMIGPQSKQAELIARHQQAQAKMTRAETLSVEADAALCLLRHLQGVVQTEQSRHTTVHRVAQLQEEVQERRSDVTAYRAKRKFGAESRLQEEAVINALNAVAESAEKDLRDEQRREQLCRRRVDHVSSASRHAGFLAAQIKMAMKQANQDIKDALAAYKHLQEYFNPLIN